MIHPTTSKILQAIEAYGRSEQQVGWLRGCVDTAIGNIATQIIAAKSIAKHQHESARILGHIKELILIINDTAGYNITITDKELSHTPPTMLTLKPNQPVQWSTFQQSTLNPQNLIEVFHRGTIAEVGGNAFMSVRANRSFLLVKHSHTGQLEMVDSLQLFDLPIRTD